jgi:hypothetical protein
VTPRHEAPGDLHHTEHNAITDQAAQLVDSFDVFPDDFQVGYARTTSSCACPDCTWIKSAAAVLREVARG